MDGLRSSLWVTQHKANPDARLRLFCFPYAGGGTALFHAWHRHLPEDIEVCAILLPGRESRYREPAYDRLPPLITTLSDVLAPFLDKPFAFFGHSMGALISFELARQIHLRFKRLPVHLFVSGRGAPQLGYTKPPIHGLPQKVFIEELRHMNGTPEEVLQNAELMQLLLPTLRADFAVCENYVYTPDLVLDCPISAFGGDNDPRAGTKELAAWHAQTSKPFTLQMFPGNHFFIHSAAPDLLTIIEESLSVLLNGDLTARQPNSHPSIFD